MDGMTYCRRLKMKQHEEGTTHDNTQIPDHDLYQNDAPV